MSIFKYVVLLVVVVALGAFGFLFSGVYPMGADQPHWKVTTQLIEVLRDASIRRAASNIAVPDLTPSEKVLEGAQDFNAMCTGCHLTPAQTASDMNTGLYPQPPNLFKPSRLKPNEQFWVIKHGLKMTGMPAWKSGHDDARIWAMVAFIQQMPTLDAEQYQLLTATTVIGGSHE